VNRGGLRSYVLAFTDHGRGRHTYAEMRHPSHGTLVCIGEVQHSGGAPDGKGRIGSAMYRESAASVHWTLTRRLIMLPRDISTS